MAPTTPTGSRQTFLVFTWPVNSTMASPSSTSQGYVSMRSAGYVSASVNGRSSCGPWVTIRGHPTSRMSSSRKASFSPSSALCNCRRHCWRNVRLVDQSVSSKALRAASMARCMSADEASVTSPSTSSVAGLVFANRPAWPSTSLPSISIRDSNSTAGVSITGIPFR